MRRAPVLIVVALPLVGLACVDLFHDTDFAFVADASSESASAVEAATDAPIADVDATPPDFCAITMDEARPIAHRACALLAACMTPLGTNAVGECLEHALPIVGCQGAPDLAARGPILRYYQCLATARTCDDVRRCVLGDAGTPSCGNNVPFTQCQGDVRLDCRKTGQTAGAESCAATGRVCVRDGTVARCMGSPTLGGCTKTTCEGATLQICDDAGRDEGFSCSSFGKGNCGGTIKGTPACASTNPTTCTPTSKIACSGRVAVGCATGHEERIDCQGLFGTSCTPVTAEVDPEIGWDVSRACEVKADAGRCSRDSCSGATLYACVHGNATPLDCTALMGGTCGKMTTADGTDVATCVVP